MKAPTVTLRVPGDFIALAKIEIKVTQEFRFRLWIARQFILLACIALGTSAEISTEIDSTPNLLNPDQSEE